MRGKRAKARTGRVVGARPPYGYDHVRDENGKIVNFEPIEEEAQIVRLIFQWYVIGDETGNRLSAAKIAKRLSLCRYQLQVNQTLATAASESRACGVHLQFSISSLVRPMQVYGVLVSALVQPEINAQRRMD